MALQGVRVGLPWGLQRVVQLQSPSKYWPQHYCRDLTALLRNPRVGASPCHFQPKTKNHRKDPNLVLLANDGIRFQTIVGIVFEI